MFDDLRRSIDSGDLTAQLGDVRGQVSGATTGIENAFVFLKREKSEQIVAIFPHKGVACLVKLWGPRLRGHSVNLTNKQKSRLTSVRRRAGFSQSISQLPADLELELQQKPKP